MSAGALSGRRGKRSERLGKRPEQLGKRSERRGKRSEQLGKRSEELGKRPEQLGKRSERRGKRPEQLGKRSERRGKRPGDGRRERRRGRYGGSAPVEGVAENTPQAGSERGGDFPLLTLCLMFQRTRGWFPGARGWKLATRAAGETPPGGLIKLRRFRIMLYQ
ncbi:MAG: hypothetical protein MdMp014T_1188 [Treponematales bacterium]